MREWSDLSKLHSLNNNKLSLFLGISDCSGEQDSKISKKIKRLKVIIVDWFSLQYDHVLVND